MVGWIADSPSHLNVHLYADADFAGCVASQRSTSGAHLTVRGPKSSFPISCLSKRQGCVSLSTPEAEIIATQIAVKSMGLPAVDIWHTIHNDEGVIQVHEDNQAMIAVVRSGKNPTMRHIKRTHGVSIAWLHERFEEPFLSLHYEISTRMAADIYTKAFTDPHKWQNVCELINVIDPERLSDPSFFEDALDQSPSLSGGPTSRPPPPEDLPSKPGWDQERPIVVVKHPLQMKTPYYKYPSSTFDQRTTWMLHRNSPEWEKVEDKVMFERLPDPTAKLRAGFEKGIFIFSSSA